MNSNLKLFKLLSGEEVLATIVQENDSFYEIEKAISLVYTPVEGKGMVASFAPFLPYCDSSIILFKGSLCCIGEVQDKVEDEYRRAFSDIIIAPANAI